MRVAWPGQPLIASAATAALLTAGCFEPSPAEGLPCSETRACPAPLVCNPATSTCERDGSAGPDAALIDAALVDASPTCVELASDADEDGDLVVDRCDTCPHEPNADQADTTEVAAGQAADGVGDACDLHPTRRDRLVLFAGFKDEPPAIFAAPGWSRAGGSLTWEPSNSAGVVRIATGDHATLVFEAALTTFDPRDEPRQIGAFAEPGGAVIGAPLRCMLDDDPLPKLPARIALRSMTGELLDSEVTDVDTDTAFDQTLLYVVRSDEAQQHCVTSISTSAAPSFQLSGAADVDGLGGIGLDVTGIGVALAYVVVYSVD